MKKKSIKKNFVFDLIYRIITLIVPLVTAPYISRVIGVDGIGNYSFTQSICSYFCFFAILGSNVYGQREIAFCNGDKEKMARTFWSIYFVRTICITIVSMLYLVFGLCFDGVLKVLFLIQLIDVAGCLFDITWFYQGMEEFGKILVRNLIMKSISVVSIFLFVRTESDLYIYVLMTSFANVFSNALMFLPLKKYISFCKISKKDMSRHVFPIFKLFIPTIALNLYNQVDKTMLGFISNSTETGYYEQSTKIIIIINTFVSSISNVMSPRISSLTVDGDCSTVRRLNRVSFELIWFIALPISFGLISISPFFVPLFFGDGYEKVSVLLRILSIICIPMGIKTVIGMQYLIPNKLEKEYTISIFVGLITNIILNSFLIYFLGSVGASIASLTSEVIIVLYLLIRYRNLVFAKDVFNGMFLKTVAATVMFFVVFFTARFINGNVFKLIYSITLGGIVYFAVLLICKDKFIYTEIKNFFYKNKRNQYKGEKDE